MTTKAVKVAVAALVFACASLLAALPVGAAQPQTRQSHAVSAAPDFVPGEVVVRFQGQGPGHAVELPPGVEVGEAAAALRANPRVAYAVPNYIATASAFVPNDPGKVPPARGPPRGWARKQWNFLCGSHCGGVGPDLRAPGGIDAIRAWRRLIEVRRPGARGVRVAVLDTGIAYKDAAGARRSPDFGARQFLPGYDFVSNDAEPLDQNGHGTHIAGTIGERANNRLALTGLAYAAKLMPVRVLNAIGNGPSDEIAQGIRFAVRHGAKLINMSFNFDCGAPVTPVAQALAYAHRHGVVLVASVGNGSPRDCIAMPATAEHVIAVGGTTANLCSGDYSRTGAQLDLVAPGGGRDARGVGCASPRTGPPILQLTFRPGTRNRFAFPTDYVGTSMAAAHVTGVAAMVLASGVVPRARPDAVAHRLRITARDLGPPGRDPTFGCGVLDAGAAVDPAAPVRSCG
jgi:serine protease